MNVVLYHANCADGFCAAYYMWKMLSSGVFIPMQYSMPVPSDQLTEKDTVYLVDFSFKREDMHLLASKVDHVIVLDHHKTAEAELKDLTIDNIEVYFDMRRSGAALAYDYCMAIRRGSLGTGIPDYDKPALVRYVQDRDLWTFALHYSREISAYIKIKTFRFGTWDELEEELEHSLMSCVIKGEAILAFQQRQVEQSANAATVKAFPLQPNQDPIDVIWAPIVNATNNLSEIGDALCLDGHEMAVCWFMRKDGKYQYSLRSRGEFDVSEIAKAWGGGGHKNAAGFESDYLVFE